MYSFSGNCTATAPISTFMCLWAIYILPTIDLPILLQKICRHHHTPKNRHWVHCKEPIPKIWNKYSQKRNSAATVTISTFMCWHWKLSHTAKIQYRKFETNIPRKGIARPVTVFTFMCLWAIYIFPTIDLPILLQRKYVDRSWEYINRSDTWMWTLGLRPRNSQKRNI